MVQDLQTRLQSAGALCCTRPGCWPRQDRACSRSRPAADWVPCAAVQGRERAEDQLRLTGPLLAELPELRARLQTAVQVCAAPCQPAGCAQSCNLIVCSMLLQAAQRQEAADGTRIAAQHAGGGSAPAMAAAAHLQAELDKRWVRRPSARPDSADGAWHPAPVLPPSIHAAAACCIPAGRARRKGETVEGRQPAGGRAHGHAGPELRSRARAWTATAAHTQPAGAH